MSYQYIIDNAETLSISKNPVVATTFSRDSQVRTISRGGSLWKFEIKLPDGPRWTDQRRYIQELENYYTVYTDTIQINLPQHSWINRYLGNYTNLNQTIVQIDDSEFMNKLLISSGPPLFAGYKFRTGDFIQLTGGSVYTVIADVPYNSNNIFVNRPIVDVPTIGYTPVALKIAQDCTWTVGCIQFPQWTIFARDQVSWSGSFILQEIIVG